MFSRSRGHQQFDLLGGRQHVSQKISPVRQLLEVIQHQQRLFISQVLQQLGPGLFHNQVASQRRVESILDGFGDAEHQVIQ